MSNYTLSLDQANYSVRGKEVLKPVSIDLAPGKITAIVGPNGSGKSTLLKLLSGLLAPTAGKIFLDDKSLTSWPRKSLARELTLLPQHSPVPLGMSVEELVACGRYPYAGPFGRLSADDHRAVSTALGRVEMAQYATELVDHLSGGEMQRVWLAMVLAQETGILLLDEPTSWLDIAHQLRLLEIVKNLNKDKHTTVVWVLHDLNQALQYSDEILLMNEGEIVRKGPAQQVLDSSTISNVFNVTAIYPEGQNHLLFLPTNHADPLLHQSNKEVA